LTKLNENNQVTDPMTREIWPNEDINRVITEYNRVFNENIIIPNN